MPPASTEHDAGMSIVEALVALAVFAMAGVGLIELQAQSLRTLSSVEQRALGDIVAQNHLVGLLANRAPPAPGEQRGQDTLAGRDWRWRVRVAPTADANVLRIDVEVRAADEGPVLASAHGFTPSAEAGQ
jgi:general secretion pathway protein I